MLFDKSTAEVTERTGYPCVEVWSGYAADKASEYRYPEKWRCSHYSKKIRKVHGLRVMHLFCEWRKEEGIDLYHYPELSHR